MTSSIAGALVVVSIVVLALGIVLVPIVVTRMPADYFVRVREHHGVPTRSWGPSRIIAFWLRNAAGGVLVLAGIAMLVLPGQGVLTILAGLSLLNFPGKRKLELRMLRTPAVRHPIDKMRARGQATPAARRPQARELRARGAGAARGVPPVRPAPMPFS